MLSWTKIRAFLHLFLISIKRCENEIMTLIGTPTIIIAILGVIFTIIINSFIMLTVLILNKKSGMTYGTSSLLEFFNDIILVTLTTPPHRRIETFVEHQQIPYSVRECEVRCRMRIQSPPLNFQCCCASSIFRILFQPFPAIHFPLISSFILLDFTFGNVVPIVSELDSIKSNALADQPILHLSMINFL